MFDEASSWYSFQTMLLPNSQELEEQLQKRSDDQLETKKLEANQERAKI